MKPLKTISYRGGIARFDIPAHWKEEYEPSGGATFYEDRPDSGTLRLHVLSFSSNGKLSGQQMVAGLIADNGFTPLGEGLAIKQFVEAFEEEGEQLSLHSWQVAIPIEGDSTRVAIFSYTVLASHANDPQTHQELDLLSRCIRAGQFSREPGVSGDYQEQ